MMAPKEVFVGIDVAKLRNAVAIADAGRDGETGMARNGWSN